MLIMLLLPLSWMTSMLGLRLLLLPTTLVVSGGSMPFVALKIHLPYHLLTPRLSTHFMLLFLSSISLAMEHHAKWVTIWLIWTVLGWPMERVWRQPGFIPHHLQPGPERMDQPLAIVRATLPPSTLFADRVLLCRGYSISDPNAWGELVSKPLGLTLGLVYNLSRLQLTRWSLHSITKWEWHRHRCWP